MATIDKKGIHGRIGGFVYQVQKRAVDKEGYA